MDEIQLILCNSKSIDIFCLSDTLLNGSAEEFASELTTLILKKKIEQVNLVGVSIK